MSRKGAPALPASGARTLASRGHGSVVGPRGRSAQLVARAGIPVAVAPPEFAEAWERVCARVVTGEPKEHAAHVEFAPLGLSGSAACERARRYPAQLDAYQGAKEAYMATLWAELSKLGRAPDMAPADRVRAQTIHWQLAKLDARYNERSRVEVSGQDGGPVPLALTITAGDARYLARDEDE